MKNELHTAPCIGCEQENTPDASPWTIGCEQKNAMHPTPGTFITRYTVIPMK